MENLELERQYLLRQSAEINAKIKALTQLKMDLEGFASGTKHILKESLNENSLLYGKVRGLHELIVPKKGYERHVAIIMHRYVNTLAVQTKKDFEFIIAYANKKNLKDYSIICLESISSDRINQDSYLVSQGSCVINQDSCLINKGLGFSISCRYY